MEKFNNFICLLKQYNLLDTFKELTEENYLTINFTNSTKNEESEKQIINIPHSLIDLDDIWKNVINKTKSDYVKRIKKLQDKFNTSEYHFLNDKKDDVVLYIENKYVPSSQKTQYATILSFLSKTNLFDDTLYKFYNLKLKQIKLDTIVINEEKKNKPLKITFSQIEQKLENMEKEYGITQDFMIMFLQINITMRRDFCSVKINNIDTDNDNYLDKENKVFVFHKINKNKKNNEKITYKKINKKIWDRLLVFITNNSNNYLFETNRNNPYSPDSYTRRLKTITKKYLGIVLTFNDLRHIKITHFKNKKIEEKEKLAIEMGNTISEQVISYQHKN